MTIRVKGGALLSRFAFLRDHGGEEAVRRVMARLSESDRTACASILTAAWYPFELNEHLDAAVAAEVGMGEQVFVMIGEKSAIQNLNGPHKAMLSPGDPHLLLRRTPQIYRMYYDTGRREYEKVGATKAILRTFEAETFSANDCLTVAGWHRKAIEMCGGRSVRVIEARCRAKGAELCEYVCEWS